MYSLIYFMCMSIQTHYASVYTHTDFQQFNGNEGIKKEHTSISLQVKQHTQRKRDSVQTKDALDNAGFQVCLFEVRCSLQKIDLFQPSQTSETHKLSIHKSTPSLHTIHKQKKGNKANLNHDKHVRNRQAENIHSGKIEKKQVCQT